MMPIGIFARQVAFVVVRRHLNLEISVQSRTLFQPKNVFGKIIHPLQPNCLPSNLTLVKLKSTKTIKGDVDEKFTARRWSPEDDQKLLEHVNLHGKTAKSLKEVAVTLNRTYASVRYRIRKLLSTNEFDVHTDPREWNYDEDYKLVEYIFNLKEIKPSSLSSLMDVKIVELKQIAPEFQRSSMALYDHWKRTIIPFLDPHLDDLKTSKSLREDVAKIIEQRHEKKTTLYSYSEEDKKFIIKQVKLKGDVPETWTFLAKKLGRKNPTHVKNFYYNHILTTPKVKGSYTPDEDEIILKHVKENGNNIKSFRDLAKELGRGSPTSVVDRHKRLIASNEFETNAKRKAWELDEDMSLMNHVFSIKEIKANDTSLFENVKTSEFTAVAIELKRSSKSCYVRWMQQIAPTLKTHLMKLPMTNDWKKDVLSYIVNNNIKHKKEMNIDQILKENAPGQTSKSIISYLDTLKKESINGIMKPSKLPLCDLASKRLMEQSPTNPLFNENHKEEQKRVEWRENVISYYKTLI